MGFCPVTKVFRRGGMLDELSHEKCIHRKLRNETVPFSLEPDSFRMHFHSHFCFHVHVSSRREVLVELTSVSVSLIHAIRPDPLTLPPCPNGIRKLLQHRDCVIPSDASVGDADSLFECLRSIRGDFLVALVNVRLDHDTYDGSLAITDLIADDLGHFRLVAMVLVGIACTDSVSHCPIKDAVFSVGGYHGSSRSS